MTKQTAQAVGIPVSQHLGGQLATTSMAIIKEYPLPSSPMLSTFLIERVLRSKNLSSDPFQDPVGRFGPPAAILDFADSAVLQAVSEYPQCC